MGLIRAAVGAVGGTFADQWKDFLTLPSDISQTTAVAPAVRRGTNAGRGSNRRASDDVITNGSMIVVPEGYGLLTLEEGEITSLVTEAGAYLWNTDDPASKSIFVGDGIVSPLIRQSWARFKFGGRPGAQQTGLFICMKDLPNNKFGTQSAVYWDDAYLRAQVGATTRGTYSIRIVDPVLFAKAQLPAAFLQNAEIFDFTEPTNALADQLFAEVVASLAAAFSSYTNDVAAGNRITNIQRDAIGFSQALAEAVEENFRWSSDRGLQITKVAVVGIEYDEPTQELLKTIQRADALTGTRATANLQASVAAGLQSAGEVDGSSGILGLGIAAQGIGVSNLVNQPPADPTAAPVSTNPSTGDGGLVSQLEQLKAAFESGLISQAEFDTARAKVLGL